MVISLFGFFMTVLFVNVISNLIGVIGEGLLIVTIVFSTLMTLIMIFIYIKIKNMFKQVFHRTIPNTLNKED